MGAALPIPPPGFYELSPDEKIEYIQSLWDHVASDVDSVRLTDWQKKLLDERVADYEKNPDRNSVGHGPSWDTPSPGEERRMTRAVRFRPQACEDVDNAISWYGDERPALAFAFAESLDALVARISETPLQFPVVHGYSACLARTFPVCAVLHRGR
jgi:putative addiction module component (TIGR02574 family)